MKRKYITPAIEVIKVSAASMMATSGGNSVNKGEGLTENNKDDFEVLGRDDNHGGSSNIWDSAW